MVAKGAFANEPIDGWVNNENVTFGLKYAAFDTNSESVEVTILFSNQSNKPIVGPLRFAIQTYDPNYLGLKNAEGKLGNYSYLTLVAEGQEVPTSSTSRNFTVHRVVYQQPVEPNDPITESTTSLSLSAVQSTSNFALSPEVSTGGFGLPPFTEVPTIKSKITGAVYSKALPVPDDGLTIDITSPETLKTVGYSPYQVSGTINNSTAELTLNGVPVNHQGGIFTAHVELTEGFNTVVARATTAQGEQVTDSIVLSLDLTPPYLTVESHTEAQTVYTNKITVTGLINDIVRGTVEAEQAQVQVNGITANVSNRSYAAHNIPLTEGENKITITGVDQVGNSASIVRKVIYKVVSGSKLELVSGQNQQALITSQLPEALKVQLVNELGTGIADETVIFRVIQGAGMVGVGTPELGRAVIVTTDVNGFAQTSFLVGPRSGVANHKVKAKVVGYENEIIFTASAISAIGDKISVNSGNNQRGIVGQTLPAPFIVAVTDHGANTVKGARIRFDVIKGEGLFQNNKNSYETTTDSDGRASAQLTLGELTGLDAQKVEAVLIDSPTDVKLLSGFSATAFVAGEAGNTSISGVVLDNQDAPIPGVTVRIEKTDRLAITDAQGQFKVLQAPVGPVHIIVDGSTATVAGEFPSLGSHLVTVSGVDNPMSAPVYMVKLDTENGVYAGKEDVVLTLDNFPGFKLEIAKDSVTFPNGSREGTISVTSVNASKVPMAPPNGMQPQFIVTIQPVGATFSPAAKLTLPNIDGHTPGAQVEMYSFDHDLEEFVAIGLGTVSADGSVVSSNPGIGVIKAGWHCGSSPRGNGTAHNCPTCQGCSGTSCGIDDGNIPKTDTIPGNCHSPSCFSGKPSQSSRVDDTDEPVVDNVPGNCFKTSCDRGAIKENIKPDATDISKEDEKCKFCDGPNGLTDKPDTTEPDEECKICEGGESINVPDIPVHDKSVTWAGFATFIGHINKALGVFHSPINLDTVKFTLKEVEKKVCCKDRAGEMTKEVNSSGTVAFGFQPVTFPVNAPPFSGSWDFEIFGKNIGIGYGVKVTLSAGGNVNIGNTERECQGDDCWSGGANAGIGVGGSIYGIVKNPNIPAECGDSKNQPCALAKLEGTISSTVNVQASVGCDKLTGSIGHGGLTADVQVVLAEGTWTEIGAQDTFVLLNSGTIVPLFNIDI